MGEIVSEAQGITGAKAGGERRLGGLNKTLDEEQDKSKDNRSYIDK